MRTLSIARFRMGVLPLCIESGRYELCGLGSKRGLPIEYRVCQCCNLKKTEDDIHFLLECHRSIRSRNVLMKGCNKDRGARAIRPRRIGYC